MRTIEQLLETLRAEAQQNPAFRNAVELLLALGEEILRPSEHQLTTPTHDQLSQHPSVSEEGCTENEASIHESTQSPSAEDLERLIAHFRSGEAHDAALSRLTERSWAIANEGGEATLIEPPFDAELVATRARLKAEVARWCADRLRGNIPPDAEAHYYRSAITRAKALPQCYLWMLDYRGPITMLEYVADCYDAVAEVAELVPYIPKERHRPDWADRLLELAATAQSALHHALRNAGQDVRRYPDSDQEALVEWLKWYTKKFQKFIPRHMELRDPADYTRSAELIAELDKLRTDLQNTVLEFDGVSLESGIQAPKPMPTSVIAKKRLRTLRYHVGHILRRSIEPEHHWRKIREQVESLVESGIPPSNVELRDALLPIIEEMPTSDDFLSQPLRLVLREIDRYLARQESSARVHYEVSAPSPEVLAVRSALIGKVVLLIGGDERPYSRSAIEKAFGLAKLEWIATRPHESLDVFLPYLKRPEIALVLLAIRWSSHSYGEIAPLCKEYGKSLVRLPGGYSPNQIAAQIIAQAGTALANASSGGRT
ncbi:MAG: hypothetical protein KatS3mg023_3957 [Armatimonadota bacterium]|nr:MAG: hypothetical protein KatS3mg023_3957 [Armatimonadota bacterium]